jgi:hypothetical protein
MRLAAVRHLLKVSFQSFATDGTIQWRCLADRTDVLLTGMTSIGDEHTAMSHSRLL